MALQWNFKMPTNSEIYSKVYRGEKTWYLEFALKHFRRQRVLKKGKRIGKANMENCGFESAWWVYGVDLFPEAVIKKSL